jgi:hypothetical protein
LIPGIVNIQKSPLARRAPAGTADDGTTPVKMRGPGPPLNGYYNTCKLPRNQRILPLNGFRLRKIHAAIHFCGGTPVTLK